MVARWRCALLPRFPRSPPDAALLRAPGFSLARHRAALYASPSPPAALPPPSRAFPLAISLAATIRVDVRPSVVPPRPPFLLAAARSLAIVPRRVRDPWLPLSTTLSTHAHTHTRMLYKGEMCVHVTEKEREE